MFVHDFPGRCSGLSGIITSRKTLGRVSKMYCPALAQKEQRKRRLITFLKAFLEMEEFT